MEFKDRCEKDRHSSSTRALLNEAAGGFMSLRPRRLLRSSGSPLSSYVAREGPVVSVVSKPPWALKWLPDAHQSESCCGKSVREIKTSEGVNTTKWGGGSGLTAVRVAKHRAVRLFVKLDIHRSLFPLSFHLHFVSRSRSSSPSAVEPGRVPQCQRALWQQDIDSCGVAVNVGINMCVCVCVCVPL